MIRRAVACSSKSMPPARKMTREETTMTTTRWNQVHVWSAAADEWTFIRIIEDKTTHDSKGRELATWRTFGQFQPITASKQDGRQVSLSQSRKLCAGTW
jgi:hypothetical protein